MAELDAQALIAQLQRQRNQALDEAAQAWALLAQAQQTPENPAMDEARVATG